jgi:hypothetical protein
VFNFPGNQGEQLVGEWTGKDAQPQVRFKSDNNADFIDIGGGASGGFVVESTGDVERFLVGQNGDLELKGRTAIGTFGGYSNVAFSVRGDTEHGWLAVFESANGERAFDLTSTGEIYVAQNASVNSLRIRGGADVAEPFAVSAARSVTEGMVLAIDPDVAGQLRVADAAYDRRVAGVVSGAGGLSPGVLLTQEDADGMPVALSGRVHVWADADKNGPITPGDLLTTSTNPGHAMRASDPLRSQGAILGKAMTALDAGRGLVLVLVALQ